MKGSWVNFLDYDVFLFIMIAFILTVQTLMKCHVCDISSGMGLIFLSKFTVYKGLTNVNFYEFLQIL